MINMFLHCSPTGDTEVRLASRKIYGDHAHAGVTNNCVLDQAIRKVQFIVSTPFHHKHIVTLLRVFPRARRNSLDGCPTSLATPVERQRPILFYEMRNHNVCFWNVLPKYSITHHNVYLFLITSMIISPGYTTS